jgi:hypothetical protein
MTGAGAPDVPATPPTADSAGVDAGCLTGYRLERGAGGWVLRKSIHTSQAAAFISP